ncbi:histidine-histamine antiporter [Alphaproteobacteria bacterium]|nr:histidine-histamine antiporter [Alphaproteobacteria bacterium]
MSLKEQKIGAVKATSLVAGNMIGSGVLLAPAILAPYGNMAIVGWIVTTIGALALALAFSKLSIWIPRSGGPYTYAKHVFGDFVGFQMAWGYWISAWCGSVSLLSGTLQYMSIFCPSLIANQMFSMGFGIALIALFTFINMRGIKESTFIEVIIVIIKILPLIIIAILGIFYVDFSNIFAATEISNCSFLSSFGGMSITLLWAFIGLESGTVPSDSVENPTTTIPLATIAGVLLTASVYICGAIVITGLIPHGELLASKAPYVDAAEKIFGKYGAIAMIITGTIGLAGSLNGWILLQGQVASSAASEGLFPKYFLKTNKHGAPRGVVVGSILMMLVFLLTYQKSVMEHVKLLIEMSVLAMLLPYFYSAVAFCYLAFGRKKEFSLIEKCFLSIVGIISILYTFIAIFGSEEKMVFLAFAMFLISVPFYCFTKKTQ